jgi:hypothetical protein
MAAHVHATRANAAKPVHGTQCHPPPPGDDHVPGFPGASSMQPAARQLRSERVDPARALFRGRLSARLPAMRSRLEVGEPAECVRGRRRERWQGGWRQAPGPVRGRQTYRRGMGAVLSVTWRLEPMLRLVWVGLGWAAGRGPPTPRIFFVRSRALLSRYKFTAHTETSQLAGDASRTWTASPVDSCCY